MFGCSSELDRCVDAKTDHKTRIHYINNKGMYCNAWNDFGNPDDFYEVQNCINNMSIKQMIKRGKQDAKRVCKREGIY